jgi:hypothetical protein
LLRSRHSQQDCFFSVGGKIAQASLTKVPYGFWPFAAKQPQQIVANERDPMLWSRYFLQTLR